MEKVGAVGVGGEKERLKTDSGRGRLQKKRIAASAYSAMKR